MFTFYRIFKKSRPVVHHIISASLIISYWWALWNIFDAIFLHHSFSSIEIVAILGVAMFSLVGLFILDVDFSDI